MSRTERLVPEGVGADAPFSPGDRAEYAGEETFRGEETFCGEVTRVRRRVVWVQNTDGETRRFDWRDLTRPGQGRRLMRIGTALEAYDDASTGAVSTGWLTIAGYHCGIGVSNGVVRVWLSDDTSVNRAFAPADYEGPHAFIDAICGWLDGLEGD